MTKKYGVVSENTFLWDQAYNQMGWGHPGPWIGLQDADLDGQFTWNDGSTPSYTEWCSGSPVAAGTREYVHMEIDPSTGSDRPCWADNGSSTTVSLPYICSQN